jgi:hypothetical protein
MANDVATSVATKGAFKGLKTPRDILNYNLMRGVTDFSNLKQWDLYEKGYPFLCVISIPQFLKDLADRDKDGVGRIINNYVHVLENDFKGIDNLDNISADFGEVTNGIRSIQLINKVNKPSNSNFNLTYYERSGSLLTKAHELYMTGIKDPDTQVKHYHGLIDDYVFGNGTSTSGKDPGFHQEVFTFLYFMTDNTMTKVERAFLIAACQPTIVPYSDLYTGNKGDIQFAEVSLPFNGFFINNDYVYQKAQDMLLAMRNPSNLTSTRILVDSNNFKYSAIADAGLKSDEDKFSTPVLINEADGKFNNEKWKESYTNITPNINGPSRNTTPSSTADDVTQYNDMLKAMEKKEHFTDFMETESGQTPKNNNT